MLYRPYHDSTSDPQEAQSTVAMAPPRSFQITVDHGVLGKLGPYIIDQESDLWPLLATNQTDPERLEKAAEFGPASRQVRLLLQDKKEVDFGIKSLLTLFENYSPYEPVEVLADALAMEAFGNYESSIPFLGALKIALICPAMVNNRDLCAKLIDATCIVILKHLPQTEKAVMELNHHLRVYEQLRRPLARVLIPHLRDRRLGDVSAPIDDLEYLWSGQFASLSTVMIEELFAEIRPPPKYTAKDTAAWAGNGNENPSDGEVKLTDETRPDSLVSVTNSSPEENFLVSILRNRFY